MRHPLWILNSALLLLLIICAGLTFVAQVEVPEREEIAPLGHKKTIQKETPKINLPAIYERDLFGSYTKKAEEEKQEETPIELPPPPPPVTIPVPPLPQPQFIAPLKVTLKGIIIVANEDNKNRAIIADNTTNKESLYKVEDIVEDARLIKILHNKVIFLRANGQQEVLYLRQKDAELDPVYTPRSSWQDVIERVNGNTFMIHTDLFVDRVTNLAQCIDLLDLITVYQKGKSVGCRIGLVGDNSLGQALGFQAGDIITSISDIPTTDTENRMKIYKKIINMKAKESFDVTLNRQGQQMSIKFVLSDLKKAPAKTDETGAPATTPATQKISDEITNEQLKTLEDRHTFAPTLKEIRERERQNMLDKGRTPQKP
jgi:type II secretion system protein C